MKEKQLESTFWGVTAKEYYEQVHGHTAFHAWHSTMFPGQQLEMDAWKPTVAKDVPHPTLTRNVMYTMCMDVPYYVRSLTSAFNYIVTVRDEQLVWYDEEKRVVTMYSRPWTVLPILGHMQWSKIYLSGTEIVDANGRVGLKFKVYGVTHVEKAPLGLRRAMEMLITGEMLKNISALHRIIGENLVEFTRLKQKDCPRPPDVVWAFDSARILESWPDWHDALSSMSDFEPIELEHPPTPPSNPPNSRRDLQVGNPTRSPNVEHGVVDPWGEQAPGGNSEAVTETTAHHRHSLVAKKPRGASKSSKLQASTKVPGFSSVKRHTKALISKASSSFKKGGKGKHVDAAVLIEE